MPPYKRESPLTGPYAALRNDMYFKDNDPKTPYAFSQKDKKVILASASPRRKELCQAMGLSFTVSPTDADESLSAEISAKEGALIIAKRKAEAGRSLLPPNGILIAADTVVDRDGEALGKPKDGKEALSMLLSLSGKTHYVHTGVAVLSGERLLCGVDTTAVTFRAFDEKEALAYVKTGEPMDKAGAYGIQGLGGALVDSIEGAFDNVVGLPTRLLDRLLCEVTNG